MEETVAKWEGMALPESADEYDEWRTEALRVLGEMAGVARAGRDGAGKVLYLELRYRGEAAYVTLRDDLAERFDVSTRTIQRWRSLIEARHDLPPASPRVAAGRIANSGHSVRSGKADLTPSIVPNEVIAPSVARHPAAAKTTAKPVQMAFTFETPSQRLVSTLASVPPGRHEALADAIEKWLSKPEPATARPRGEVTPMFKGGKGRA